MSITRQQLANRLNDGWNNEGGGNSESLLHRRWLAAADAAIAALDAADKIAPELPEGWFGRATPRPANEGIVVAYVGGEVRFHWASHEAAWHHSWQYWQPIVMPAHPSQHQENPR